MPKEPSWMKSLKNVWIGTSSPPSDEWRWLKTPDSLVVWKDVGFLAIEWDLGGKASGLDYLKVMVSRRLFPVRGVCVFESDPYRRKQMTDYLRDNVRKVGFTPGNADSHILDRMWRIYESADSGRTWVDIPY